MSNVNLFTVIMFIVAGLINLGVIFMKLKRSEPYTKFSLLMDIGFTFLCGLASYAVATE